MNLSTLHYVALSHPVGALASICRPAASGLRAAALLLAMALPVSAQAHMPYSGTPAQIPGAFEAEDFNLGGEGDAYHDSTPGNQGGQYRAEDVDIAVSADSDGGNYVVRDFVAGEWLAYTVHVADSGQYDVELRVSGTFADGAFHIEVDGRDVTGSIVVPNTGDWNRYQWVGQRAVPLTAGEHIFKVVADRQCFNLNSIRVSRAAPSASGSSPFLGAPVRVPALLEAENFDLGGQDVAYHDNVPGNAGGQYRPHEDVDIIVSKDAEGGGYVVQNFELGEWLAYTIEVPVSGNYSIDLRVATRFDFPNSAFHLEVDDANMSGSVVLPTINNDPDSGWHSFQWSRATTVFLSAGEHVLKVFPDQQYFNLNAIRVSAAPGSIPFSGTPISLPGTFEAEDFDLGGEGVAYHDNVAGNAGGNYRPGEDVDIVVSADSEGGGFVVNNLETGEWLAYTVNVSTAGNYDIELRAATSFDFPGSAFHVEIDGVDVTGRVTLPDTGGWNRFQWVGRRSVPLAAGQHLLRIVADQQYFDLNAVRVTPVSAPPPSVVRREESAASYSGSGWMLRGAETAAFSAGSAASSNLAGDSASFSFNGTAVSWIGLRCSVCGIAMVSIDGGPATTVDTAGPAAPGNSRTGIRSGVQRLGTGAGGSHPDHRRRGHDILPRHARRDRRVRCDRREWRARRCAHRGQRSGGQLHAGRQLGIPERRAGHRRDGGGNPGGRRRRHGNLYRNRDPLDRLSLQRRRYRPGVHRRELHRASGSIRAHRGTPGRNLRRQRSRGGHAYLDHRSDRNPAPGVVQYLGAGRCVRGEIRSARTIRTELGDFRGVPVWEVTQPSSGARHDHGQRRLPPRRCRQRRWSIWLRQAVYRRKIVSVSLQRVVNCQRQTG